MAYTEQTMFEYIKSSHNIESVTFPMCVNSFHKFEKGSQPREILVNLACKILIATYIDDPASLGLTKQELENLITATLEYK